MTTPRLLVVGGTGFVGIHICKAAVKRGWNVSSLSRRQHPDNYYTAFKYKPSWANEVNWLAGDVFDRQKLQEIIPQHTAVVHSLGVLFDTEGYKGLVNAKNVSEMATVIRNHGAQMARSCISNLKPEKEVFDHDNVFERINRDSAIILAEEFVTTCEATSQQPLLQEVQLPQPVFVYMSSKVPSAITAMGIVSQKYQQSKYQAEHMIDAIARDTPLFRFVSMRPGLMYSEQRPLTMPLAQIAKRANSVLSQLGLSVVEPLDVSVVGEAVVGAIADSRVNGIVDEELIKALGAGGQL